MTSATARELVIDVPCLPPAALYPNKRLSWQTKHRVGKAYGETVELCAIDARNRWEEAHSYSLGGGRTATPGWQPIPKATGQFIVTFPAKRRGPLPDVDNLDAALKSARDALTARDRGHGVVGAGIIEDDGPGNVTWLPTQIGRGEEERVRIIIREVLA